MAVSGSQAHTLVAVHCHILRDRHTVLRETVQMCYRGIDAGFFLPNAIHISGPSFCALGTHGRC
jgi:hypothetical protein